MKNNEHPKSGILRKSARVALGGVTALTPACAAGLQSVHDAVMDTLQCKDPAVRELYEQDDNASRSPHPENYEKLISRALSFIRAGEVGEQEMFPYVGGIAYYEQAIKLLEQSGDQKLADWLRWHSIAALVAELSTGYERLRVQTERFENDPRPVEFRDDPRDLNRLPELEESLQRLREGAETSSAPDPDVFPEPDYKPEARYYHSRAVAKIYEALGAKEDARKAWEEIAGRIDHLHAQGVRDYSDYETATTYMNAGRREDAKEYYKKHVEFLERLQQRDNPLTGEERLELASSYAALGENEKAARVRKKSAELDECTKQRFLKFATEALFEKDYETAKYYFDLAGCDDRLEL